MMAPTVMLLEFFMFDKVPTPLVCMAVTVVCVGVGASTVTDKVAISNMMGTCVCARVRVCACIGDAARGATGRCFGWPRRVGEGRRGPGDCAGAAAQCMARAGGEGLQAATSSDRSSIIWRRRRSLVPPCAHARAHASQLACTCTCMCMHVPSSLLHVCRGVRTCAGGGQWHIARTALQVGPWGT